MIEVRGYKLSTDIIVIIKALQLISEDCRDCNPDRRKNSRFEQCFLAMN